MEKYIVIIGMRQDRELSIKTLLERMDVKPILIESYANKGFAGFFDETIFLEDITNVDLVYDEICYRYDFNDIVGVTTLVEHLTPVSSSLASRFDLISIKNVEYARNKYLMRKKIEGLKGISHPKFEYYENLESVDVKKYKYPIVIKPIDMAAGIGVKYISDEKEMHEAIIRSVNYDNKGFLFESYIEGKEYSADGYINDGKTEIFCFTEKIVEVISGHFIEVGHVVPYKFEPLIELKLKRCVEDIIKEIGISDCIFHLEFKIDNDGNFYFIEVGARPGGDHIMDLINLVFDVNPYEIWIDIALGLKISKQNVLKNSGYAGIRYRLNQEDIKRIKCKIKNVNIKKQNKNGNLEVRYNGDRESFVIVTSNSYEILKEELCVY